MAVSRQQRTHTIALTGKAIEALRIYNLKIEESMPKLQTVPAYAAESTSKDDAAPINE